MEHQLNISIIAPRGTGKTTLIGALYDYARSEIKNGDGFKFEVLKEYQSKLDVISKSLEDFRKNLEPKSGTSEIERFSFRYTIDDDKIRVNFVDVPGGFTENAQFGSSHPEYNAFYDHLKTSPVLIVPIDTPCLMEGNLTQQNVSLDLLNVSELIIQWAQFRAKKKKRAVLHFVMLKSEYYNYDGRQEDVFKAFSDLYKDLIFLVWSKCRQKLEINYTPVTIFDNIHLDKAKSSWKDIQYNEAFKRTAETSKTKGLSDLWGTIEEFVEDILEESYIQNKI